jgi:hypothetical protein
MKQSGGSAARTLGAHIKALSTRRMQMSLRSARILGSVQYVRAMNGPNWRRLDKASNALVKRQNALGTELKRTSDRLNQLQRDIDRDLQTLKTSWVPPNRRAGWTSRRADLAKELKRRHLKPGAIKRLLDGLGKSSFAKSSSGAAKILDLRSRFMGAAERILLRGKVGARLARCVVALNAKAPKKVSARGVLRTCKTTQAWLTARERALYGALRAGKSLSAQLRSEGAEQRLRVAVKLAGALAKSRQVGQRRTDRELGEAAIAVGNTIRGLLRHLTLIDVLRVIDRSGDWTATKKQWVAAARALRFASPAERVKRVPLATLARRPKSVRQNTRIEVSGRLGMVHIGHIGAHKAISRAALSDSAGNSVTLEARHRKMDSAGMVEGCYVRAVGDWQAGPQNTVLLARHRYTEAADSSWIGWVTLRLRPMYEASTQGLATEWSWERGRDGAGNQLRYGLWGSNDRSPVSEDVL